MAFVNAQTLTQGYSFLAVAALSFFSFVSSVVFSQLARRFFLLFNLLDRPDNGLKVHKSAVPFSGGLAVFLATFFGLCATHYFWKVDLKFFFILAPFFFLGLFDDIFSISQKVKFLFHFGLVFFAFYILQIKFNLLELVWTLAMINAFNLIDVADGLCATIAAFSALGFAMVAMSLGRLDIASFFGCVFGASTGFLTVNFPTARAYLGDSGSTFLGSAFALGSALIPWHGLLNKILISSTILGLPLAEVLMLVLIRTYLGIAPYKGSPHHFYNFLKQKNWSIYKILLFVTLISCALLLISLGFWLGLCQKIFFIPFVCLAFLLWILVVYG
jgi:UDP-GlcNAc:undecaprenyl-phosphate GlcNAc-1-phosphate transferase